MYKALNKLLKLIIKIRMKSTEIQQSIDHHQSQVIVHLQALIKCYSDPSLKLLHPNASYLQSINSMISTLNNLMSPPKEDSVCETVENPICY